MRVPQVLFKYYPPSGVIALRSRTVRFTQPGDLNDPLEARLGLVQTMSGRRKPLTLEQAETRYKRYDRNWGVLCLSEIHDSLLMWAHYADSHRGFVVAFDMTHSYFKKLNRPVRVRYARHRPMLTPKTTAADSLIQELTTKRLDWRYEREWRILSTLGTCRTAGPRLFVKPLDLGAVQAIFLGVAAPPSLRRSILSIAKRLPRIWVFQAQLDSASYSLVFDPSTVFDPDSRPPTYAIALGRAPRDRPIELDSTDESIRLTFHGGAVFVRGPR